MERRIENRQLTTILTLFLIVQFGGLLIAVFTTPVQELYAAPIQQPSPQQASNFIVTIFLVLVVMVIFLLFLFRVYHGDFIYRALEAYAVGVPMFFLFLLVINTILPNLSLLIEGIISAIIAIAIILAKNRRPQMINSVVVLASMGLGLLVGGIGFTYAYIFFAIFSMYDYVAVFVTKHMQVMAKELANRNLAFLIGSTDTELIPKSYLSDKEKAEFKKSVKVSQITDPVIKRLVARGNVPTVSRIALGAGDLGFPLILATGAYLTFRNTFVPLMIIIGATFGLLATMQILRRYKIPLPALPPLFAYINLFLGINFAIFPPYNYVLASGFIAIFMATLVVIYTTVKRITRTPQPRQ